MEVFSCILFRAPFDVILRERPKGACVGADGRTLPKDLWAALHRGWLLHKATHRSFGRRPAFAHTERTVQRRPQDDIKGGRGGNRVMAAKPGGRP